MRIPSNISPFSLYNYNEITDFLSIREQKEILGVEDNTFIVEGYGVVDRFPTPHQTDTYLTFTTNEDVCTIGLKFVGDETPTNTLNIEYSIDNGITWNPYIVLLDGNTTLISINKGEKIKFRGINETFSTSETNYYAFVIIGNVAAYGDITSILNGRGGDCILPPSAFINLFKDCVGLTNAPNLPSTTLSDSCYYTMFQGCTSLISSPELPSMLIADKCYAGMFYECSSLTTPSELPATTLGEMCYNCMFYGCTSLRNPPALPASVLEEDCYGGMFYGCTSLETAPELPAEIMTRECYYCMFKGCISLTTAPELPATTLAKECYYSMFNGCTGITTAPILPATTLVEGCYWRMFQGCTSLNTIVCLATDNSASDCTYNWVNGVNGTGLFTKAASMNNWSTGINGIPSGWTVQEV